MKAIIYAGIGLFAAASVYGLADYYSSQKKGLLDKLYKEEDQTEEVKQNTISIVKMPLENTDLVAKNARAITTNAKTTKKNKVHKRTIKLEDFSRGRISESIIPIEMEKPVEIIKEAPPKKEETRPVEKEIVTEMVKAVINKQESERKISLDMFSRAPLKRPAKTIPTKIEEPKTIVKTGKQQ